MAKRNLWWGSPGNFSERKSERKVSWLELFYDLGYVAVIGQLTHHAATHPSWHALGMFFLLFSMVFWSWVNGSQYYDLHGEDNVRTRIFTFWQILAIAAVAITLNDAFEGHPKGFAVTFLFVQLLITYLWWSVGLYDRSHRVFNKFYTFNYLLAFALLATSFFTDFHTAVILWWIALLLNLTPSLTGARTIVRVLKERGEVFSASTTLVERFGLFTIIVLAESILGTVTGISEVRDKHPVAWVAFILALLIAFLLWCLYFDMTSEQETKSGYSYLQWLLFLHFPLLASFAAIGGCIRVLLIDIQTGPSAALQWIFCGSLAVALFTISGISRIMKEEEEDRAYIRPVSMLLVLCGVVLLVVPLFGKHLDAISLLGIAAFVLFVPVCIGIVSWARYKYFS
jgi:low temperature requirement protein LtrA